MKKILFALVLVMIFASSALSGEVLVIFKAPEGSQVSASGLDSEGVLMASVNQAASEVESEVVQVYKNLSEIDGNIFVLLRSKTKTDKELIRELKARPDVIAVSPNHKMKTRSMRKSDSEKRPNDPDYNLLWGLEAIRAPEAWTETTGGGENIYAAIIDSGFYLHEDLKDNLAEELGYNLVIQKNEAWSIDAEGHGTHVAGIIGAVGNNNKGVTGVNWNVKIIPMSIYTPDDESDDDEEGSEENNEENEDEDGYEGLLNEEDIENLTDEEKPMFAAIAIGLDYIAKLKKNNPDMKIAAINLSMGFYLDDDPETMKESATYKVLKVLDSMDTLLIVSAGNEGLETGKPAPFNDPTSKHTFSKDQYEYPASFTGINNMIRVGATDSEGNASDFTCWGDQVDIAAPGSKIYSTYSPEASDSNGAEYKYLSGTSMSAPFVTGAAALLLSRFPEATPSQIKNALLDGANTDINPVVHPFNYEARLEDLADTFGWQYETLEDIVKRIELIDNEPSFDIHLSADIMQIVRTYSELDSKGRVSRTGLLDLKAALDILSEDINSSNGSNGSEGITSNSSSGCNTGFEGIIFTAALILIPIYCRRQKK